MRVKHLVGAGSDPIETLLPESDDFGCCLEKLVGEVSSFGFAFPRFGPSAQWLFYFPGSFDRLADQFDEVPLRLDHKDT